MQRRKKRIPCILFAELLMAPTDANFHLQAAAAPGTMRPT
jgi:hypothetical protein